MGPKKKETVVEEEDNTYKLYPLYKRKCDLLSISMLPSLKQTLEEVAEKGKFESFCSEEPIGPLQIRSLMATLNEIKYNKFKCLRVWRGGILDEGVRNICKYLDDTKDNKLEELDLLENQITPLGCQFLAKSFLRPTLAIKILKLDDNNLGLQGIKNLSQGLRVNSVVTRLSLKCCAIPKEGVRYLQDIIANISTKIKSIILEGNNLGNDGVYQLLRAIQINEMLQEVSIADTGLNLLDFKAQHVFALSKEEEEEQHNIPESQNSLRSKAVEADNPEKNEGSLQNVKQVVAVEEKKVESRVGSPEKSGRNGSQGQRDEEDEEFDEFKEKEKKLTRTINEKDKSLEAKIMRKLSDIFKMNMLISKYDIRFNPISDDAANILFEIIEENGAIKDIEFNNNVDAHLREILDTLMRRRTGRMPKGRGGAGKRKTKKK